MNVLGLDLSLTQPGFAIRLGPHAMKPPLKKGFSEIERLAWFDDYITMYVTNHEVKVVCLEGYSFASKFHRAEAIGELGGVVRLRLYKLGIPFIAIPPTTVKKYATGKGNADKDSVLSAAIKRSDLEINNNNAADAWWLYQIGCTQYAPELAVPMPELNRTALDKIEWPEIGETNDIA